MDLGYCPNCGALDADYTGGGNPYNQNAAEVRCNKCGHKSTLIQFRKTPPPSPKTNAKRPSAKKQEQKQEQPLSEKIAYEEARLKRMRLEFEQNIEQKKLEFELYMQKKRESFKQEIEYKKLMCQLDKERRSHARGWTCDLLVPIIGAAGIIVLAILVIYAYK